MRIPRKVSGFSSKVIHLVFDQKQFELTVNLFTLYKNLKLLIDI